MDINSLSLLAAGSVGGGVVSLAMGSVVWRIRDRPAAVPFGWMMLAIAGWCFFTAARMLSGTPFEAYAFDRAVRLTSTNVPPLALTFVLAYAGHDDWLTPKRLGLLWIYPVTYAVVSLTAPVHGLTSTPADVTFQTVGGVTAPVVPFDPVKAAHVAAAYAVVIVAYVVLFRLLVRARSTHRGQAVAFGVGALIPFVANAVFYFGDVWHPGLDPTPVTFVVTGVVIGWGVFRYNFLSVTPMASDVLVDELPDPVLILDEDDRVVDHNPATESVLDVSSIVDEHVHDVAPDLLDHVNDGVYSIPEVRDQEDGVIRYYDPNVTTLDDQHGTSRGRLVLLREVTGQQRRQDRLEALQRATQQFITATTDDRIARLSVDFVERALDRHAGCVFLVDDGTLRPAAATDYVREYYDETDLHFGEDSSVYEVFETQRSRVDTIDDDSPFNRYALYPLGDHGVLGIGSQREEPFASDDDQFVTILARATQVALSQVEHERELRRSRESIQRRSEQIEFFNGVLRHTLRNALLVIQGRADHLSRDVDGDGQQHLDVIEQWCDDLETLNDEIRAINDTVTATESERFEVVNLTRLLRDRAREIADGDSDLDISLDVGDGLEVYANELVGRVITSVVLNAVSHNDTDSPRVEITTRRTSDRVEVHVADNGPGMSEEMKERVLERDVATSETSHGFGLYFVSVMMNLYGGTIWFRDNEPRGTVACLEFQTAGDDGPPAESVR